MIDVTTSKNGSQLAAIAFISMIFSVLSILMSAMMQVSRIHDMCRPESKRYNYTSKCVIFGAINLKSQELKWFHAFTNNKMSASLNNVFASSRLLSQSNIIMKYEAEAFYFENFLHTLDSLRCHFQITVLSFQNDSAASNNIASMFK